MSARGVFILVYIRTIFSSLICSFNLIVRTDVQYSSPAFISVLFFVKQHKKHHSFFQFELLEMKTYICLQFISPEHKKKFSNYVLSTEDKQIMGKNRWTHLIEL